MLAKEQRIAKKKDFDHIFSGGKSKYTKILGVKLIKNGLTFNRFGLIISNKVSKLAVERNRLRRILYSNLARLLLRLEIGYDMIIIVLPPARTLTSAELAKGLEEIFKNYKILNVKS